MFLSFTLAASSFSSSPPLLPHPPPLLRHCTAKSTVARPLLLVSCWLAPCASPPRWPLARPFPLAPCFLFCECADLLEAMFGVTRYEKATFSTQQETARSHSWLGTGTRRFYDVALNLKRRNVCGMLCYSCMHRFPTSLSP